MTGFPSFNTLSPYLSIIPLDLFKAFFLHLSFLYWPSLQEHCICALSSIGGQIAILNWNYRKVDGVPLPKVPIPHTIEVNIATIVSRNLAHFLTMLKDLTPDVVLLAPHIGTKFDSSRETVRLIFVGLLALDLMAECTH